MKVVTVLSATLLGLLLAAAAAMAAGPGDASPVATVGGSMVSAEDLGARMAVERAYGNEAPNAAGVLVALVGEALEREVALALGVEPTAEEIAALGRHADETSKAPEILAAVKAIFGDDRVAYERLYLAPKIRGRKLRAWYGALLPAPQLPFARWMEEQARATTIEIADGDLAAEIRARYPQLWWAARSEAGASGQPR